MHSTMHRSITASRLASALAGVLVAFSLLAPFGASVASQEVEQGSTLEAPPPEVAVAEGMSLVDLAYAWLAARPGVDSILVGPAEVAHLVALGATRGLEIGEQLLVHLGLGLAFCLHIILISATASTTLLRFI